MKNNYIFKYVINIISLIFFCFSYYLYYISLEKCFSGIDICGRDIRWIFRKVFQIVVSCFIFFFFFFFIYFKIISKLHIFHFLICFYIFYSLSHGYSFEDHGLLNFIGFLSILSLIIIIGLILKGFISLTIENDLKIFGCQIKYPKSCPYKILKYVQDLTKFYHINCSVSHLNNKDIIFENSQSPFILNNSKKIGFPLTNKDIIGRLDGKDDTMLTKYVLDNLFDIENNTQNISDYELILDFSKNDLGEYIIDLKYNNTLSKERKLLENKITPYSENIMILFIDSVSRGNSIRQLTKTLNFFEKFMPYNGGFNPEYPEEKFHSFQFFKYIILFNFIQVETFLGYFMVMQEK